MHIPWQVETFKELARERESEAQAQQAAANSEQALEDSHAFHLAFDLACTTKSPECVCRCRSLPMGTSTHLHVSLT